MAFIQIIEFRTSDIERAQRARDWRRGVRISC